MDRKAENKIKNIISIVVNDDRCRRVACCSLEVKRGKSRQWIKNVVCNMSHWVVSEMERLNSWIVLKQVSAENLNVVVE